MASGIDFRAQAALKTCENHAMEELDMYCKTCGKPICEECLKKQHIKHDWCKLSKMARQLRSEIPERDIKISSQANTFFSGMRKVLQHVRDNNNESLSGNTASLESVRSEMHAMVDKIIDADLNYCKTHHEKIEKKVSEFEEDYLFREQKIKKLSEYFRSGQIKYTDFDLVELYDNLARAIRGLKDVRTPEKDALDMVSFHRGNLDQDVLISIVGRISHTDTSICKALMKKISQFKVGNTGVNSIHVISDSEAWIHTAKTTQNTIVSLRGEKRVTRELNGRTFNFDMIDNDGILFCDIFNKKTVDIVDKSGHCKVLFGSDQWYPAFVTVTHSGELLISMWNEESASCTKSSHGLVRKIKMTGDIIHEYKFDNDGETTLFHKPYKAVEHYKGGISVIDKYRDEKIRLRSKVYGLDINRNVKFRYTGQADQHAYSPLDICCDVLGNTITTDSDNRAVHVIDTEGNFIRYLVTRDMFDYDLYSLSLYGNKLWIGTHGTGMVYVFESGSQ